MTEKRNTHKHTKVRRQTDRQTERYIKYITVPGLKPVDFM